jgi:hypothetical protein
MERRIKNNQSWRGIGKIPFSNKDAFMALSPLGHRDPSFDKIKLTDI